MQNDSLDITILEDGTVKIETDKVSNINHISADNLVKFLSELAGGKTTRTRHGHTHNHSHDHSHEPDHEKH